MVGVAGKSKACHTCRRRRVRCDERRPTCERCEKGNHECEGYQRKRVWIDEGARTVRLARRAKPWEYLEGDAQAKDPNQNVPAALGLVAFQQNIYVSYLLAKLFRGGIMCIEWNWLQNHVDDTSSVAAQDSLRALSTAYFGRMHGQRKVMSTSHALYGKALRSLNADLQDHSKAWNLSVMTSAMCLQIYEFIVFSSVTGWLQHAGGVAKLIELRGPWRHQALYERHLLEINRLTICLSYLLKRKRCFLEQPDWITVPWALDPASKSPILRLQDILCSIPGLVEDATNLKLPRILPERYKLMRDSLSERILEHLLSIYAWRATWEAANPHTCHAVVLSSDGDNNNNNGDDNDDGFSADLGSIGVEPVFPSVIHFANLTAAYEITLYNTMLLLVLRLGTEVIGPGFELTVATPQAPSVRTNAPLLFPGETTAAEAAASSTSTSTNSSNSSSMRDIATEICRSVHYHLLEKHDSAGPFYLLFPLRTAYQVFAPASREAGWLQAMMRHIANLSGFEISRKLSAQKPMRYTALKTAYAEHT